MHLDAAHLVLVAGAALLAGAVNAVAGGGTLLSFPALLLLGFPALTANVTSTIGLLPGFAGGSVAYYRLRSTGIRTNCLGQSTWRPRVSGATQ